MAVYVSTCWTIKLSFTRALCNCIIIYERHLNLISIEQILFLSHLSEHYYGEKQRIAKLDSFIILISNNVINASMKRKIYFFFNAKYIYEVRVQYISLKLFCYVSKNCIVIKNLIVSAIL